MRWPALIDRQLALVEPAKSGPRYPIHWRPKLLSLIRSGQLVPVVPTAAGVNAAGHPETTLGFLD